MIRFEVQPAELAQRFADLVREWQEGTAHLSSVSAVAAHPAYQQIIGMGPAALPFILRALYDRGGQWFWALKAITGVDPVPAADRGSARAMRQAWLEWAREQGLRW